MGNYPLDRIDNGLIQPDDADKLIQLLDGWIPRTINFMKSLRS